MSPHFALRRDSLDLRVADRGGQLLQGGKTGTGCLEALQVRKCARACGPTCAQQCVEASVSRVRQRCCSRDRCEQQRALLRGEEIQQLNLRKSLTLLHECMRLLQRGEQI